MESGRSDRDSAEIQFKFRVGLEGYTLWKHEANLPLLILSASPAELCIFKVSHKSQMHIAVYSGLIIKKWAQMIQQKKPQ